jgi:hypothetical protein
LRREEGGREGGREKKFIRYHNTLLLILTLYIFESQNNVCAA